MLALCATAARLVEDNGAQSTSVFHGQFQSGISLFFACVVTDDTMMEGGLLIRIKSVMSQLATCDLTNGVDEVMMIEVYYIWIPSESACSWERKIKGQKHIQLIAIDYHSATGTAGTRCQKHKGQSQPACWSPFWTPVALRETQGQRS